MSEKNMTTCPNCGSEVCVTFTPSDPYYTCGSTNRNVSKVCIAREPLFKELQQTKSELEMARDSIAAYKERLIELQKIVDLAKADKPPKKPGWAWWNPKRDTSPARGLWAPGEYINKCARCSDHYLGDKRSQHCAECGYSNA